MLCNICYKKGPGRYLSGPFYLKVPHFPSKYFISTYGIFLIA